MSFEGRVAVITGGSRGIGRAIALAFAEAGAHVVVNYYLNTAEAEASCAEIIKRGVKGYAVQADLKDPEQIPRIFEAVRSYFGRLEFLVNNAASGVFRPAISLSPKHWDWTMDTNVRPLLLCAQAAAPLMSAGGRIVSVSSLGAGRVIPNYTAVGVSKAALEALTRYLAVELAPQGITVNAVSAGAVVTDGWRGLAEGEEVLRLVKERTPNGRLLTPEDVAAAVLFLCRPEAEMIQGQVIVIDGGFSLLA
ncbi:MAG: enoyl-[acyl-carrier-protein] reductase FabL [Candidatus Methylomirabilia bacterium]